MENKKYKIGDFSSLIGTIRIISDKDYQERIWVRREDPTSCDTYEATTMELYEVGDPIVEDPSDVIMTKEQYRMLKNLCQMVDEYDSLLDQPEDDEGIVNDPRWHKIIEYAKPLFDNLVRAAYCPSEIPKDALFVLPPFCTGLRYLNPLNSLEEMRIFEGNPNSPAKSRQERYVLHLVNGQAVGFNGNTTTITDVMCRQPLEDFSLSHWMTKKSDLEVFKASLLNICWLFSDSATQRKVWLEFGVSDFIESMVIFGEQVDKLEEFSVEAGPFYKSLGELSKRMKSYYEGRSVQIYTWTTPENHEEILKDPKWHEIQKYAKKVYDELQK
ncbi:hypothetical protein [Candidatus Neptunochlamydia vexilliferae]|uniref:Uncharacterized protein n=1 Tax=Candidatus Neptunichlamydia vexilliferae TaxID=1651774 RepID=A0ABS0AXS2_9BACT|nr:hypothetical protein [Candidatus Neptunochlamydia vexilliferae]MBF5058936.1 hypothetical protein [Candidatus Neptunochlamydia vexilliferae]